jgi:hypothetical protein
VARSGTVAGGRTGTPLRQYVSGGGLARLGEAGDAGGEAGEAGRGAVVRAGAAWGVAWAAG